jgi:hypothetical protein
MKQLAWAPSEALSAGIEKTFGWIAQQVALRDSSRSRPVTATLETALGV